MRRILMLLALSLSMHAQTMPALVPIPPGSNALGPAPDKTSFTFIVAGDNRPAKATCPITSQLKDIRKAIGTLKPSFVLWDGDVVYGKNTAAIAGEYPSFLNEIAKAKVPVFVSPGNHELTVSGTVPCGGGKPYDQPDTTGAM